MRTTLELTPENHTALRELAARRGEKGYSRIVNEAIDRYVHAETEERRARTAAALEASHGIISEEEGEQLQANIRKWRESWRS
jgi:hypothetical protein